MAQSLKWKHPSYDYDGFLAENMMKRHDLLRVKASSPTEAHRSLSSSSSHHLYWARTREESICDRKGEGRASEGTVHQLKDRSRHDKQYSTPLNVRGLQGASSRFEKCPHIPPTGKTPSTHAATHLVEGSHEGIVTDGLPERRRGHHEGRGHKDAARPQHSADLGQCCLGVGPAVDSGTCRGA